MLDELHYRKTVGKIFEAVALYLDRFDPDVIEAELSQGALTILVQGKKVVLSPQPPVRQIWLAAAHLGIAMHFSFNDQQQKWLDDKTHSKELFAYTSDLLAQASGAKIDLRSIAS